MYEQSNLRQILKLNPSNKCWRSSSKLDLKILKLRTHKTNLVIRTVSGNPKPTVVINICNRCVLIETKINYSILLQKIQSKNQNEKEGLRRPRRARSTLRAEIKDGDTFGASSTAVLDPPSVSASADTSPEFVADEQKIRFVVIVGFHGKEHVLGTWWRTDSPGMWTNDGWVIVDNDAMAPRLHRQKTESFEL